MSIEEKIEELERRLRQVEETTGIIVPIEHLGFSTRYYNKLIDAGITDARKLYWMKDYEIANIKGIGKGAFAEIEMVLGKWKNRLTTIKQLYKYD